MTITGFHLDDRRGGRRRQVWQAAPWERFEARGVIASAIALAALTAAATAGGAVASGAIGSHAAGEAAKTTSDSSLEAARIAAKAQADATAVQLQMEREATAASTKATNDQLAYTKGQAALSRQDAETNREGDYEQWAAREGRLSTIGGMLGMPARQIPAYRALGPDTSSGGSDAPLNPALLPKQGEVNWSGAPDQLGGQLSAYFQARGVAPSEVPYWVQHAQELVNRGKEINDPQYADKRLAAAEIFGAGGGAGAGAGAPAGPPAGSIAAVTGGGGMPANTPAYRAPRIPMPGSIRSLAA